MAGAAPVARPDAPALGGQVREVTADPGSEVVVLVGKDPDMTTTVSKQAEPAAARSRQRAASAAKAVPTPDSAAPASAAPASAAAASAAAASAAAADSAAAASSVTVSPAADSSVTDSPAADSSITVSTVTDSAAADGTAADSSVTVSAAADSPAADSPAADSPAADSPVATSAAADSPAADSPVTDSPVTDSSVTAGTAPASPAHDSPARDLRVHDIPVLGGLASVRGAPIRSAPVRGAPIRSGPVRAVSVRSAPVRPAPVKPVHGGAAPDRPGDDLFARYTRDYVTGRFGQQIMILLAGCTTAGTDLGVDALRAEGTADISVGLIDDDQPVTSAAIGVHESLKACVQGDLRTVPLPPRSQDIVLCSLLLHRVRHAELVLDRLVAAIKPGGLLLLRFCDRDSAAGFLDRRLPRVIRGLIWRNRRPGEPGPHPAVYERLTSARGVQAYALKRGLVISERTVLGGLAGQLSGPAGFLAVQKVIARLSGGRLTVAHEELLYVLRKPENRFARVI